MLKEVRLEYLHIMSKSEVYSNYIPRCLTNKRQCLVNDSKEQNQRVTEFPEDHENANLFVLGTKESNTDAQMQSTEK